ncbi:hypothetical protein RO3G_11809 [Rhizopus delemar RA 99-880]|uniref:Uncharacterized protein n=1 Tax=Rhizopus delemar (strain RA 99-880 / ATCC MYA-4621 / FGSC 9543 / NRRL 43880) TaxID=246409 RepID=I1CF68_RHIO9|nr:hypothetical protein RO3G_11809 [Rhizopus delemar RA 99-880]|eukprot:EIE87098.1 hypothetical protein RO3G_11809 [Rhizopus delemar RA 99-880]
MSNCCNRAVAIAFVPAVLIVQSSVAKWGIQRSKVSIVLLPWEVSRIWDIRELILLLSVICLYLLRFQVILDSKICPKFNYLRCSINNSTIKIKDKSF